jgi:hypothetical protein
MSLDQLPLWVIPLLPGPLWVLVYFILIALLTDVSAWMLRLSMHRRIKKDLGRKASEGDLLSIGTWMKVDEAEQKKHPGSAWAPPLDISGLLSSEWTPSPSSADDYVTLIDLSVLMDRSRSEFEAVTLGDLPTRLFRIKYDSKKRKKLIDAD